MTPHDLAILEQEISANLQPVPALHRAAYALPARLLADLLDLPRQPGGRGDVAHVVGPLAADVEGDGHAERAVQRARGVGEDGEGAAGVGLVGGDHAGGAAADDDDVGGDGHGEVGLRVDALGEGLEVGLAGLRLLGR